jgi:putative FmdB family regulatory protein
MPTYEYECETCHQRLEAVQKFADPALTTCPACGGVLRKVFSAVGIVFKGTGFYKNDSRGSGAKEKSPASASTPAASSSDSGPSSGSDARSTSGSDSSTSSSAASTPSSSSDSSAKSGSASSTATKSKD